MDGKAVPGRHAGLTRLRFFLIAWVVLYHLNLPLQVAGYGDWAWPWVSRGYLGVDGFFLLSGFALWLGYGMRPPSDAAGIGRFLLRRFAKVFPLHVAALLGLALLVWLATLAGATIRDPERFSTREFFLQLFLVHGWETTDRFAWNYPSWALSVEWAGYLVFPAVLALLLRLPRPATAALPLVGLLGLWALSQHPDNPSLNHTLHLGLVRFGLEFVIGLALGRLATEARVPPLLPWVTLPAIPAGLWLEADALTVTGLAALIVAVWHSGRSAATPRRPDLLLRLGEASFGIYLSWVFVEAALVGLLRVVEADVGLRAVIMLGGFLATAALGWCAWRWVEIPAQRWILDRRRTGVLAELVRTGAD